MADFWGYHMRLNVANCELDTIVGESGRETIHDFTKKLVKDIDMVAYGEPQIVHFGEGNKSGYTLIQLIETSNIAGHFCDDSGDAYLDVFSCKQFDQQVVINLTEEFFKPSKITYDYTERDANAK